jgi:hypothetical protein
LPDFPFGGDAQRLTDNGALTASTDGTTVTAGSTGSTKGSYAQIVASTAHDAQGFIVQLGNASTANGYLVDIAVGAAASEQIIVPDIFVRGPGEQCNTLYVPLPIPAGTRIAARSQAVNGSATIKCIVHLVGVGQGASEPFQKAENWGAVSASSLGTIVTASGTINTKGAWAELIAASARDTRHLILLFQSAAAHRFLIDLGIGAAASEQVLIPNLFHRGSSSTAATTIVPVSCSIPAGTRVAARCQSNTASQAIQLLAVAFG